MLKKILLLFYVLHQTLFYVLHQNKYELFLKQNPLFLKEEVETQENSKYKHTLLNKKEIEAQYRV